jgi:pimeloyl-ACP methyl ester carboxylesterase
LLAWLGVALVVLAGCAVPTSGHGLRLGAPVAGTPVPAAAQLRDCTDQLLGLGVTVPKELIGTVRFGCGRVRVPLDYTHPRGKTITLAMVRIHTLLDTRTPVQSLLVNPGGPGGSGLQFGVNFVSELPAAVLRAYDIIAFDPRGVGESSPLECVSDAEKDRLNAAAPDVTTAAGLAEAKRESALFADACVERYGADLQFYNTLATARDMDQIRQAVGDDRLNYLGFSYGTELGWTYAHLFPKQVGAFVLDGAVDPSGTDSVSFAQQLQGFEDAFGQFATHCRGTTACRTLGDPRASAARIVAAARRSPLTTGSGRRLTEGLAVTGVLSALYSKDLWPALARALISAVRGDGSGLLALADRYNERSPDGSYTNIQDANDTISCNDTPRRAEMTDAQIRSTARQWAVRYPTFGRVSAAGLLGCRSWQPHRTPVPAPSAPTLTTVLVVGNLHDPATPYAGAEHLAHDLGHAELLTWDGEGHTSYRQGSSCIDRYVTTYLTRGTLPPDRTVCPAQ